jgi:hypothetical protein
MALRDLLRTDVSTRARTNHRPVGERRALVLAGLFELTITYVEDPLFFGAKTAVEGA